MSAPERFLSWNCLWTSRGFSCFVCSITWWIVTGKKIGFMFD